MSATMNEWMNGFSWSLNSPTLETEWYYWWMKSPITPYGCTRVDVEVRLLETISTNDKTENKICICISLRYDRMREEEDTWAKCRNLKNETRIDLLTWDLTPQDFSTEKRYRFKSYKNDLITLRGVIPDLKGSEPIISKESLNPSVSG